MPPTQEDRVYVGMDCGRREYVITAELVQQYADAVQDYHPWYFGGSPFGGPVAPALIRHSEVYVDRRWYLPNIYGNLHAKQEWELFTPIMVGERIVAHSFVVDRYVKRGRDYVVNEVLFFGEDNRVRLRGRSHQSFLREGGADGTVVSKEREKEPGRRFVIGQGPALEVLPPLQKEVSVEMCQRFSGPDKNYHTDRDEARKLGFPDIVVQGMLGVCFLSELLTRRFGEGWFCGGKMTVNLVNVLWGGETVAARGVLRDLTPEGSRRRAHLEVWCEKPDGTVVIVGSASVVVSPA